MSVCTFIAANCPLPDVRPSKEYDVHIDIDTGVIDDGGADDNFYLFQFLDVRHYTDKQNAVKLEWYVYTEGRGQRIIDYITAALEQTETVEIWHVWLSDYDPSKMKRKSIKVGELTPEDIHEIDEAVIWTDKYSDTPTWYCLEVVK